MTKLRIRYAVLIVVVIVLGLLSRKFTFIPLWVGDVLWATMIWFMARFIFIGASIRKISIISLAFCYAIEFSQLYKAPWIDGLRRTLFGRLVLGDTFLWGDMLSYTVGIAIAIGIETAISQKRYPQRRK